MAKTSITVNTEVEDKSFLNNIFSLLSQNKFEEARFQFIGSREKFVAKAYDDGKGFITVGYGFNMSDKNSNTEFDAAFKNEPDFMSGTMTFDKVKTGNYRA